jgi:ABC-type multidrug transport system ATPase subunit
LSEPPPLLALAGACIESGGAKTDPLSASGGARLVALVGYFSPFFRLLRGEANLCAGNVRIAGLSLREAFGTGALGLASRGVPSAAWTLERYLTESAQLSGLTPGVARARVSELCTSYGLLPYAKRRLRELPTPLDRIVPLVRACLQRPRVVFAEAPLSDLDAAASVDVAGALERVLAERALVLSFPTMPLGGQALTLFERADFVVELGRAP